MPGLFTLRYLVPMNKCHFAIKPLFSLRIKFNAIDTCTKGGRRKKFFPSKFLTSTL